MIETHNIKTKITVQTYYDKQVIDITDAVKTVHVQKSLYGLSGSFEIELLPIRDQNGLSWYFRLAPMDYVEIYIARYGASPAIIMRGFIDDVFLSTTVDDRGAPNRTYSISGRDYGKIFELTYIYYHMVVDADLLLLELPSWEFFREKCGVKTTPATPAEFIEYLCIFVQRQLTTIQNTYSAAPDFSFLLSESVLGTMFEWSLTQQDGNAWDFMKFFANEPWNELFVVDLPDAPSIVFRKTPWKHPNWTGTGNWIQGDDETYFALSMDSPIILTPNNLMSVKLKRSDAEAKNYFFTYPTTSLFNDDSFKAAVMSEFKSMESMKSNPFFMDRDDIDSGLHRFGYRQFENRTRYISSKNPLDGDTAILLSRQFNMALAAAFDHNSAFETGTIGIKGDERIKVGIYVKLLTGASIEPEYYVVSVDHVLSLVEGSESFDTTLGVTRGTGYIEGRKKFGFGKEISQMQMRNLTGRV